MEKTYFRELSGEQRRQLIDTQQIYDAWREADHEKRRRFEGSMRWVHRNNAEYLLHKIRESERSLGIRREDTEKAYKAFISGRDANKKKLVGLSERLDQLARVNKALGLGRMPQVAAKIIRICDEKEILGRQIIIVGTHALFAYEMLAGVHIDSSLIATTDIDLLYDTRRHLSLGVTEGLKQRGLIGLLHQADRTFEITKNKYRAANKDGYFVDLIRAESKNFMRETDQGTLTEEMDDLTGAAITGLSWLVNAPKVEAVALDEKGYPVRLVVIDPRAYALHKMWLSKRPDRERLKAARDHGQAKAAARIAIHYMNLSFDSTDLTALPASLLQGVPELIRDNKELGIEREHPNW